MFPSESLLYEGRARIHVRIIDFYLKSLQVKAFSSDSLVLMQIVSSLGFTADTMQIRCLPTMRSCNVGAHVKEWSKVGVNVFLCASCGF